jgi:hypothetical protein
MSAINPSPPAQLDPRLASLLSGLRDRVRRLVVWDSLLTLLAVLLAAFWLGLALDYLPVVLGGTEMPWLARLILLLTVLTLMLGIAWKMLIGRLKRPLPDDSLALLVERHHPDLGGRLVTAVQLNQPGREGDSHSPELLRQVHDQAAAKIDQVDPGRFPTRTAGEEGSGRHPNVVDGHRHAGRQPASVWPRRVATDVDVR